MKKKIVMILIIIFLIIEILILISPGEIKLVDTKISSAPISKPVSKLQIEDTVIGEGNAVKPGDTVVINYIGKLKNGTEFDNSYKRGTPFETTIGVGEVIKGWDEGVIGMKAKGKRKLTIPPELGYGSTGSPPKIPPNSILIFDIELLEIK